MAINFPTSLDTLTNPTASDKVGVLSHSSQHADINDIAEALEAKVGINGSAVTTSHDYKLGEVISTDKAVGKTATQTLTNKTLTSPSISDPTITGAVVNAPLTRPRITTSIDDANGNEVIKTPATGLAVNEITVTNGAAGNDVQVTATGDDTNIGLKIQAKGSGKVKLGTANLQIPNADGTSGQFISTDGSGVLGFSSAISQNSIDVQKVDNDTDQTQTTQNAASSVGEANATTKQNLLAQSFIPTKTGISGVRLWKSADTGTFTGTVKIALQVDTAGSPSGSDLASFTITNTAWLKLTAAAEFGIRFSSEYTTLSTASTYWIVVTSSTSDNSNHPNLGINTAGGYASGVAKYQNTTDGWVTISGQDLYFKTIQGVNNRIVTTTSSEGLSPSISGRYQYLDINNTTVSASNTSVGTTVTTTLYSKQLEGGQIGINSGLKFNILATATSTTWDNNSNSTNYLELRYNGTALLRIYERTQSEGTLAGAMLSFDGIVLNQASVSSQSSKSFALFGSSFYKASNTSSADFSQPGKLELVSVLQSSGSGSINISNAFYGAILEKIS